jgi:hypothetical protein
LVDIIATLEEGLAAEQLGKDTADGPYINYNSQLTYSNAG